MNRRALLRELERQLRISDEQTEYARELADMTDRQLERRLRERADLVRREGLRGLTGTVAARQTGPPVRGADDGPAPDDQSDDVLLAPVSSLRDLPDSVLLARIKARKRLAREKAERAGPGSQEAPTGPEGDPDSGPGAGRQHMGPTATGIDDSAGSGTGGPGSEVLDRGPGAEEPGRRPPQPPAAPDRDQGGGPSGRGPHTAPGLMAWLERQEEMVRDAAREALRDRDRWHKYDE